MIFVYDVEYYLNVCPVPEQSFSQIWSDLKDKKQKSFQLCLTAAVLGICTAKLEVTVPLGAKSLLADTSSTL